MPAVLVVSKDKKQIAKVTVDKDEFMIGRSRHCDLHLDDKAVSRKHAVISRKDGGCEILDRNSRNGTKLNDSTVSGRSLLAEGDTVTIGPFELRFYEEADHCADIEDASLSKTSFGSSDLTSRAEKKKKKVRKKKPGATGRRIVRLIAIDGALKGTVFRDWDKDLTIGRGADSAVVLPDNAISIHHSRIFKKADAYFIEDLGSSNGTFVNGIRIKKQQLKDGDKIRIGTSVFRYSEADPARLRMIRQTVIMATVCVVLLLVFVKLLQPEDQGEKLVNLGYQQFKQGEYIEAQDYFEKALIVSPGNAAAVRGLKKAKQEQETEDSLARARRAAEDEEFDEALSICYDILRLRPKHNGAKKLELVIRSIGEARIALDARNWDDAIHLLNTVLKTYKDSTVVQGLLDKARSESDSKDYLAKAKEFLQYQQFEKARNLLIRLPEKSVYFPEAQGFLTAIKNAETVENALEAAQLAYRDGNISGAMVYLAGGLKKDPDNSGLRELKTRLSNMAPLVEAMQGAARLLSSDDISGIQETIGSCRKVLQAEKDTRNNIRIEAVQTEQALLAHLQTLADQAMQKGYEAEQSGNISAALQAYDRAVEADPSRTSAKQSAEKLRLKITDECRKYYREGIVHEELGQNDMAVKSYEKVLKTAIPGDNYYERTQERIRRLRK